MRFIVNREQILSPLGRVCMAIEKNPPIPILSQILLRPTENGIEFIGSSIGVEIKETIVNVQVENPIPITIPGITTLEFCKRLPPECKLEFVIQNDLLVVRKTSDRHVSEEGSSDRSQIQTHSKYEATIQVPGDFPEVAFDEGEIKFEIARSDLQRLIRTAQHAVGRDEHRPFLNAMMFEMSEDKLRTVSTDGHRMATSKSQVVTGLNDSKHRAIIPRKSVLVLSNLLQDVASNITVEISSKHLRVSTYKLTFTSLLLDSQYPDWRSVIPVNFTTTLRCNREELMSILRRVDILTDAKTAPGAIMELDGGQLRVQAKTHTQEINETIEVKHTGGDIKIQINGRYLLDIFDAVPVGDPMEICFRDAGSACVVQFPNDESCSFLVMLMKDH